MAVVGEQFEKFVVDQINQRQKIHGKTERTIEDLQYLNSKTAWVKLASGVSLDGDERIKNLKWVNIMEGMDLAKSYVLFGGVSQKLNNSTTLFPFGGFNTPGSRNPYNISAKNKTFDLDLGTTPSLDFGFVPPPGIESVEVKNMNRGSIKKATVKIKAYSRDQFDILDILYMRLGYTVLLEWGWSHYFSNSDKLETMGYTLVEAENGFFSNTAKSHKQFLQKIKLFRRDKSGNYDGLLAKVSNFDWSFNPDGSYDINLTLISLGDVIESLKTNVSPRLIEGENIANKPKDILSELLYSWKQANVENKGTGNEPQPNSIFAQPTGIFPVGHFVKPLTSINQIYHSGRFFFSSIIDDLEKKLDEYSSFIINEITLEDYSVGNENRFLEIIKNKNLNEEILILNNGPLFFEYPSYSISYTIPAGSIELENDQNVAYFKYNTGEEEEVDNIGQNNINYYMNFGHLLKKVKELCLPVNNNGEIIINLRTSGEMLYYPNQISFDPRICVVRGEIDNKLIFPQLKEWGNENAGAARIENIYVNFSTIQNAIDNNLDENNKLALISFLQSICNDLNRALGGINNLEPVVDEDDNLLRIIDGSYLSDDINRRDYFLEVFGYNPSFNSSNFVRNLDLKTQITPEYASMVTIGATAGGYVKGTEATMFSKWNKGIVDRFKEEYNPPSSENLPAEEIQNIKDEPKDNYIKYLNSLEKILGFDGNGKNTLDDAVIDNNLSVAEEYYKYLNALAQEEQDTFSSSTNGFIPFNLGVTMDGISGIKIYNKLNVSTRFLPQNYPDALHFIIKGVSHKISNQDWETTLETQVVPNSFIDPSKIIPRPQITTTTSTSEETTGAAGAAGVAAASTTSTINTAVLGVVDDNRRFWTLVAICSREDNNPQGYADVAQSIYNRNLGGRSIGYRSDIVDQILANSQYEPTWRFPVFRTEYKANIEWFNIKDIQTASIATGLPISTLQKVVEALKNPTLQQNARSFIKGRTDFLGSNQPASRMKQKIQRNSTNNKFGFNWGWNPANGGNAAPIPSYVTNINV
jgi:hypothetical protein